MKLFLYSIAVGLLLLGAVSAYCPLTDTTDTVLASLEGYSLEILGANNAVTGEELRINYTHYMNYNNTHTYLPARGADVYIAGYDQYGELNGFLIYATTDENGLYRFTPRAAGDYLVQIGNETPIPVTVKKNQVKSSGIVTGGVVAAVEDTPEPEVPAEPAPAVEAVTDGNEDDLLGLVINGTQNEGAEKQVPNLVMMLVGLLIS